MKHAEWKVPEWMEPYRVLFTNTGGNSLEDLMNDHDSNVHTNAVRAALAIAVDSQVILLCRLKERGMLKEK